LLVEGLQKNRFISLRLSDEDKKMYDVLTTSWHKFHSKSLSEKKKFERHQSLNDNSDNPSVMRSGYGQIYFENRDNCRDEEFRDIFILYGSELHRNDIPWPNEDLKSLTVRFANLFWEVSVAVVLLIERGLCLPTYSLVNHLLKKENENSAEISNSHLTNFSIFRYHDDIEAKKIHEAYKVPQKCMVHRDKGYVTLLPKSTFPAIQALCDIPQQTLSSDSNTNEKMFLELEKYIDQGEVLVYTGRTLEIVTKGALRPLIHRVARYPNVERVSSPFEVHCDLNTEIHFEKEGSPKVVTVKDLKEAMDWDSVQRKVLRADGISPEFHSQHLNGELVSLLTLYGDTQVVNE